MPQIVIEVAARGAMYLRPAYSRQRQLNPVHDAERYCLKVAAMVGNLASGSCALQGGGQKTKAGDRRPPAAGHVQMRGHSACSARRRYLNANLHLDAVDQCFQTSTRQVSCRYARQRTVRHAASKA